MASVHTISLLIIYMLGVSSALLMGILMRAMVNPQEAIKIRQRLRELESSLPPKHLRTPKHERKARIVEIESKKLRKRYAILTLKRLTAMFIVYGITLFIILLRLPPLIVSPVRIPLFTYEIEGQAYVPLSLIYIMIVLLLSPLSLRIAESEFTPTKRKTES